MLDALADLEVPFGVYAVPGNHDHELGIGWWHQQMGEQGNIIDLTNKDVVRDVKGASLYLAGVDDLEAGDPHLEEALRSRDRADLTVLLAHNPDRAEQARPFSNR